MYVGGCAVQRVFTARRLECSALLRRQNSVTWRTSVVLFVTRSDDMTIVEVAVMFNIHRRNNLSLSGYRFNSRNACIIDVHWQWATA